MMRVKTTAKLGRSSNKPIFRPASSIKTAVLAVCTLALAGSTIAQARAAQVSLEGDSFFLTYDDALLGLYGTPTVSGRTIFFQPTDFYSWSYLLPSLTHGTINLTVTPKNGHGIHTVSLDERGDYFLDAAPGKAMVSVLGSLRVFNAMEPGNQMVAGIQTGPLNQFGIESMHEWQGTAFLDLAQGSVDSHGPLHFTIENVLRAKVVPDNPLGFGPEAFIEKKYVALTISPAPEVEQWAMMLVGLGLVGMVAVRRRTDGRLG
jgi:hypothetical protein